MSTTRNKLGVRVWIFRVVLLLSFLHATAFGATTPLLLGEGDRLLVLAPHPDDETIAAGGLIQEALALDVPVRVCFLTMGDNNEMSFLFTRKHPVLLPSAVREMGVVRQNEAGAATARLGLSSNDLVFLGYPDFGTLDIWQRHWRTVPPYRAMLTRATAVPYKSALTPGSAYAGEDVLDDLVEVIRDFRPTLVAVSHPADHNVDHRALYLFTRVALWELASENAAPEILAYPVHFTQWPEPRRLHPMRPASPPHFLVDEIEWLEHDLAPSQTTKKQEAVRLHHSQYLYSSGYLDSFVRKSELFGDYPDVSLPGGVGSSERFEEDNSQFRADPGLFEELARPPEAWKPVADQLKAETAELGGDDNDFVRQSISGDGTRLILSFELRHPLSPTATLSLHLFGFRADAPFGEMPKIEVVASSSHVLSVKDLDAVVPNAAVELQGGNPNEVVLNIPFDLLGSPEKILVGAHLAKGDLPVDWLAWRAIDLGGAPLPSPSAPAAAKAIEPKPFPPVQPAPEKQPALRQSEKSNAGPNEPLTPRVRLPKKNLPDRTEANEPVFW